METSAAGPQASTRNSANRRPSYRHSSAHSIATLDQRLSHLESRRASNGKQGSGPISTKSNTATALDTDLDAVEEQWKTIKDLTSDLGKSNNRMQDRISFMENVQNTTEDRLRKLESVSEIGTSLPPASIAEQLRSRDERIERLEDGLRDRDERLKCLEETIQPYKLYLDKAREADQKLNQSMAQIKNYLDLKKRSKSASPFVGAPSTINNAETKSQREPVKPALPQESVDDIARMLIVMLAEGASIDGEVLIALNAALPKSAKATYKTDHEQTSQETSKEPAREESLEGRDDSRPWEAPSKLTPVVQSPKNGTAKQDIPQRLLHQVRFPENSNDTPPFKSALKTLKRSPFPNADQDDTPRKRVRISQPSTPITTKSPSKADLDIENVLASPEEPDGVPEFRRTPRASQPRLQPKDMVSWKDANESLRGIRPR